MNREQLLLYAVTDRKDQTVEEFLEQIKQALEGGITILQLREKGTEYFDFLFLAEKVKQICDRYHCPLIINDNVDIARKVNAAGVHLGQNDMAIEEAKSILGEEKIVGATAKTIGQAKDAELAGADYLGSGAIFPSRTKADAKVISKEFLQKICLSVNIPVIAIGGINLSNIGELAGIKLAGFSLADGIFSAESIKQNTFELKRTAERLLVGRQTIG